MVLAPPVVPITNPPRIRCAGNWVADAQFFAPTAGKVELDGIGTSTIDGISGAPPRVRFFDLDLANGTREPAGNLAMSIGGSVIIRDGARLPTGTRDIVGEPMRGVIRNGQLVVNAGGRLVLDPGSSIDVEASGSLRLDGTAAAAAWILDNGTPGWQLRVAGNIDALYFGLQGMGPAGVQIFPGADIGLPPYDLRLGILRRGSPGGTLLDFNLAPGAPVRALRYLDFENSPPTARHNLRARNTTRPPNTRIRLVNATGAFAGAGFEVPASCRSRSRRPPPSGAWACRCRRSCSTRRPSPAAGPTSGIS